MQVRGSRVNVILYDSGFSFEVSFSVSVFSVSDTYLRLLPFVRSAEIRSQGEKRTNDITRKAERRERGSGGEGGPATPEITLMIEMRGRKSQDRNRAARRRARRRPREREENNNPIRRDPLSSRQISGRTADGHTGRAQGDPSNVLSFENSFYCSYLVGSPRVAYLFN